MAQMPEDVGDLVNHRPDSCSVLIHSCQVEIKDNGPSMNYDSVTYLLILFLKQIFAVSLCLFLKVV